MFLHPDTSWFRRTCVTLTLVSFMSLANNQVVHVERQKFESLLAAGKPLVFPFSMGYLLSLASSEEANWNISWKGFEDATGMNLPATRHTYATLLQQLRNDENTTVAGTVYVLTDSWNSSAIISLEELGAQVKKVTWDKSHANNTWNEMNSDLVNNTSSKFDGELIPKDNEAGNPFPPSTEAVLMSTFRYRNIWDVPWAEDTPRNFGDSGSVPFLKTQHEFLVATEDEFTAVSVPLQGGNKSLVFVLPAVNITKYFRHRSNLENRASEVSSMGSDSTKNRIRENLREAEEDNIPLPTKWEKRVISLHIPSFNFSDADQFAQDLVELGLNETFCTTVHDRVGLFPYYMRPFVQINSIEIGKDSLEIMTATGTAVQKFFFGLDFLGNGYPRTEEEILRESHKSEGSAPTQYREKITKVDSRNEADEAVTTNLNVKSAPSIPSSSAGLMESHSQNTTGSNEVITFNRPFLFYLNDTRSGPLFYGVIESLKDVRKKEENSKDDEDDLAQTERERQARKLLLWSCKKFGQTDFTSSNTEEIKDKEQSKIANES